MLRILPELIMGPALVGASTLAGVRWGTRVAGLVSAFPAVVGPVLLITAQERGAPFAARAAEGTLLGLVALSAFVVAYARVAIRARWQRSLGLGWAAAAVTAALAGDLFGGAGLLVALAAAVVSLTFARAAMPRRDGEPRRPARGGRSRADGDGAPASIPARMAVTAVLVAALASAAVVLGPLVGGVLAGLPILASVLAVFTHRREGSAAVVALLRGMLVGMAGFVGFCAIVASLITEVGTAPAFAAGSVAAVGLQVFVLREPLRRPVAALRG